MYCGRDSETCYFCGGGVYIPMAFFQLLSRSKHKGIYLFVRTKKEICEWFVVLA